MGLLVVLGMKVPCAYEGCGLRRAHWEQPEDQRQHRMIEVEDGFSGRAYCSIECMTYDIALAKRGGDPD